jgi:hypothetical protein
LKLRHDLVFEPVTSRISGKAQSNLDPCTAGCLLEICNRDNGKTTGNKREPIALAIPDIKSFLGVPASFQKLVNQIEKTIEATKKQPTSIIFFTRLSI